MRRKLYLGLQRVRFQVRGFSARSTSVFLGGKVRIKTEKENFIGIMVERFGGGQRRYEWICGRRKGWRSLVERKRVHG